MSMSWDPTRCLRLGTPNPLFEPEIVNGVSLADGKPEAWSPGTHVSSLNARKPSLDIPTHLPSLPAS